MDYDDYAYKMDNAVDCIEDRFDRLREHGGNAIGSLREHGGNAIEALLGPIAKEDIVAAVNTCIARGSYAGKNCWKIHVPRPAFDPASNGERDAYAETVISILKSMHVDLPSHCYVYATPAPAIQFHCSCSCRKVDSEELWRIRTEASHNGWGIAEYCTPYLLCHWNGKRVPLSNGLLVTRDRHYGENSLICPSAYVSRVHGSFSYDAERDAWTYTDSGSKHGTKIDGRAVPKRVPMDIRPGNSLCFAGEEDMCVEVVAGS